MGDVFHVVQDTRYTSSVVKMMCWGWDGGRRVNDNSKKGRGVGRVEEIAGGRGGEEGLAKIPGGEREVGRVAKIVGEEREVGRVARIMGEEREGGWG